MVPNKSIELIEGEFHVSISGKASPSKIRRLYEYWLNKKAQNIFLLKVKQYSKLLDVEVRKITVKNMKARWGALTRFGGINLNSNLIKAPEDVIDYILIHELCHFKIRGHSHHFWKLLRLYYPRYEDAINWLGTNSSDML